MLSFATGCIDVVPFNLRAHPLPLNRTGACPLPQRHPPCRRVQYLEMRDRSFWVCPQTKDLLTTALEANFSHFFFTDPDLYHQCEAIARFSATCVDANNHFNEGVFAPLSNPQDVESLMQLAGVHDIVIIDPLDWKHIPAENLIAAFQPSRTKLFTVVDSAEDAAAMFNSLQHGVDGCVLRTTDHTQIAAFAALMRRINNTDDPATLIQPLLHARITGITPVGVGHRVCIDTCSTLSQSEGILVGSSSQALYLVLSEAAVVEYAPSRPFRINAGPVHSYCLIPGGKTRYLSELQAGDPVLIVSNDGATSRTAIVGRCKIEERPLLMLETEVTAEDGQRHRHNIFVQNAETVRLGTVHGDANDTKYGMTSVCALQLGDHLVLRTDSSARHIGMPIDEYLVEK